MIRELNAFTTGNPFLRTKLLGFSIERGSGALKVLRRLSPEKFIWRKVKTAADRKMTKSHGA